MAEITIVQKQNMRFLANRLDISEEQLQKMVIQFTGKSDINSLTIQEADIVKGLLQKQYAEAIDSIKRMKSKAIHLAEIAFGWTLSNGHADWTRFNNWMKQRSTVRVRLNDCSLRQLRDVVSQLETVANKKEKRESQDLKDHHYHE